jgi:hypothetical protein
MENQLPGFAKFNVEVRGLSKAALFDSARSAADPSNEILIPSKWDLNFR